MFKNDLTGQRFGILTVIEFVGNNEYRASMWRCICDCTNEIIARGEDLRSGKTQSCGCLRATNHFRTHGDSKTKLYSKWNSMIRRCEDPNNEAYKNYGGRGIIVCPEWHDYENFRNWVNETRPDPSLTLDRIDVNGNYEPDNCRWATVQEQQNNKRSNVMITYFDETHSLMDWCRILNLPYSLIQSRITARGWDFWTAISTPLPAHYYDDCYDYDYEGYEDPSNYDDEYYNNYYMY